MNKLKEIYKSMYWWFKLKTTNIFWAKTREDATIPTRRDEDGWYDVYVLLPDGAPVEIEPNEIKMLPTGIASAFDKKYRLDFQNERGSTGSLGITVRSGKIDSGYRGEIFLNVHNLSNKTLILSDNTDKVIERDNAIYYPISKAICQASLEYVPKNKTKEIPYEQLVEIPSERGFGKLGSSGK